MYTNYILYGKITLKDSKKPIMWKIWLLFKFLLYIYNFYYIITNNEKNEIMKFFNIVFLKNLFLIILLLSIILKILKKYINVCKWEAMHFIFSS